MVGKLGKVLRQMAALVTVRCRPVRICLAHLVVRRNANSSCTTYSRNAGPTAILRVENLKAGVGTAVGDGRAHSPDHEEGIHGVTSD